jgi:hypothetical protein
MGSAERNNAPDSEPGYRSDAAGSVHVISISDARNKWRLSSVRTTPGRAICTLSDWKSLLREALLHVVT